MHVLCTCIWLIVCHPCTKSIFNKSYSQYVLSTLYFQLPAIQSNVTIGAVHTSDLDGSEID